MAVFLWIAGALSFIMSGFMGVIAITGKSDIVFIASGVFGLMTITAWGFAAVLGRLDRPPALPSVAP